MSNFEYKKEQNLALLSNISPIIPKTYQNYIKNLSKDKNVSIVATMSQKTVKNKNLTIIHQIWQNVLKYKMYIKYVNRPLKTYAKYEKLVFDTFLFLFAIMFGTIIVWNLSKKRQLMRCIVKQGGKPT